MQHVLAQAPTTPPANQTAQAQKTQPEPLKQTPQKAV